MDGQTVAGRAAVDGRTGRPVLMWATPVKAGKETSRKSNGEDEEACARLRCRRRSPRVPRNPRRAARTRRRRRGREERFHCKTADRGWGNRAGRSRRRGESNSSRRIICSGGPETHRARHSAEEWIAKGGSEDLTPEPPPKRGCVQPHSLELGFKVQEGIVAKRLGGKELNAPMNPTGGRNSIPGARRPRPGGARPSPKTEIFKFVSFVPRSAPAALRGGDI